MEPERAVRTRLQPLIAEWLLDLRVLGRSPGTLGWYSQKMSWYLEEGGGESLTFTEDQAPFRAKENLCLVGPAGTSKSHLLIGVGHAAVQVGPRVRYFTASDLVETLYRGLADNSVGKIIDGVLRVDLVILDEPGFAPLDPTGSQLFFRFIAAAYERRSLGIASHWPFDQ